MSIRILVSMLLAVLLLGWQLHSLYRFDPTQVSTRTGDGRSEAQRLFEALRDEGLLRLDPAGRAIPALPDEVLALRAAGETGTGLMRKERLLRAFYGSGPGRAVSDWIGQWNRGRLMSAVRDDRPASGAAEPAWTAWDDWGDPMPAYGRVPLEFGYVLDGRLRPGFGDWAVVPGEPVEWRARVRLSTRSALRIQVIGIPDTEGLPPHRLRGCRREPSPGKTHCDHADPSDAIDAYEILLTLEAGDHDLRLPVRPIRNPVPEDRDLPLALQEGVLVWKRGRERYGNDAVAASARAPARFVISSSDGVLLTDPEGGGAPTDTALDLGLAGLVGYGPEYRDALSGLVARSSIADLGEATLTLDSGLQAIAQAELGRRLQEVSGPRDTYAAERRGAVVVLDARSGAILAAASHPGPPDGTTPWDRAAFAVNWPNRDPFRFTPWQGLDTHSTPGSTFKPITVLAAMKAVRDGRPDLEPLLEGWPAAELARGLGLNPSDFCYRPEGASEVCNFRGGTLQKAFGKTLRSAACVEDPQPSASLGVREAVRDSLNIWFVRLAEAMDAANLGTGGPDTFLYRQARTLGFGEPWALFPEIGGVPRDDLSASHRAYRGSVLKAQSGDLDLSYKALGAPLQRLAQNAFGQGVRASPLQMARAAAAVATGAVTTPTLLYAWEGRGLDSPPPIGLNLDEGLLDLLRQGMKAVPETGTAATAFRQDNPADACRTYGKTGTALTGQNPDLYSGWFMGWRDHAATGRPDIAFACLMTHFPNTREHTGGRLCAPVVARMLKQWERDHDGAR